MSACPSPASITTLGPEGMEKGACESSRFFRRAQRARGRAGRAPCRSLRSRLLTKPWKWSGPPPGCQREGTHTHTQQLDTHPYTYFYLSGRRTAPAQRHTRNPPPGGGEGGRPRPSQLLPAATRKPQRTREGGLAGGRVEPALAVRLLDASGARRGDAHVSSASSRVPAPSFPS